MRSMYNRYIPDSDGTFRRTVVHEPQKSPTEPVAQPERAEAQLLPPPCPAAQRDAHEEQHILKRLLPRGIDLGDLLALLIVLLLLVDSEQDDTLTVLAVIAAFVLF